MSYTKSFILFALALPAFIATANVTENKTDCIDDNETVKKSVSPVVLCFSQVIQDQIGNNTSSEGCHTAEDFNKTFENFRIGVIKSCVPEKRQKPYIDRKKYLYDLISYSLKNNTFRDFYKNNGMECIHKIKDNLADCVKSNAGLNMTKTDKMNPRYWLKLNRPIYTISSCESTRNIKMCAEEQLVHHNCTESHTKYISGLFGHLLTTCETEVLNTTTSTTNPSSSNSTKKNFAPQLATATSTIIGTITMLLFLL